MSNSDQAQEVTAANSLPDFFYFLKRQWFYFLAVPILLLIIWRFSTEWLRYTFLWLFIAAVFLSACSVLLMSLWYIPKWQVKHLQNIGPHDVFKLENEARKTVAQVLGGMLLLVSFYFTWDNFRSTHNSTLLAQRITQEGQITDRFTKAVAQLGDDKLRVRQGGIYALGRISQDSEKDHWMVVQVLITFVHERVSLLQNINSLHPQPEGDINAILTVLGARKTGYSAIEPEGIDLRKTHLQGARFAHNANLMNIDFEGANLRDAIMPAANLTYSNLKNTDLSNARLSQANLKDAYMEGTILTGAVLDGVHIDEVNLEKVKGLTWQQVERTSIKNKYVSPRLPTDLMEQWRIKKMEETKAEINSH